VKKELNIPKAINLYNEGVKDLNFREIREFIKKNFGKIPVRLIRLKERVVQTRGILLDPLRTKRNFAQFDE